MVNRKIATILTLVVALVVLAGIIGRSLLFASFVAGIWVVVAICVRSLSDARTARLRYDLTLTTVLYLVAIAIGTACNVLLSAYIALFGDSLDVGRLIALQRELEALADFSSHRLNAVTTFAILVGAYVLSCLLMATRGRRGSGERREDQAGMRSRIWLVMLLHRFAALYQRLSGPIAAGLAALAAFTFFGMEAGTPTHDLQLRLKTTQEGYAELTNKIDADVAEHVSAAMYDQIVAALPAPYRTALTLQTQIDDAAVRTQRYADSVRSEYQVSDPAVDRAIQDEAARRHKADGLKSDWSIDREPGERERGSPPDTVTNGQIEAANAAIDARRHKAIKLIKEDPREITLQIEGIGSEHLMEVLTGSLTEGYPILRPVLQAFLETIDTLVRRPIGKLYDRALATVLRNPQDLETAIERDAHAFVAETDISAPVQHAAPLADEQSRAMSQTLATLNGGEAQLDQEVGAKLISGLHSSETATREAAMSKLQVFGGRLNGQQVGELLTIMRTGGESWLTRSYIPPGGHCTIEETTSIRYYAAHVIDVIASQYVTQQDRDDAVRTFGTGITRRKIDAPGWICFYPGIP